MCTINEMTMFDQTNLFQRIQNIVWHVVLDHPLGDEDLIEVLVVRPDCLVDGGTASLPAS